MSLGQDQLDALVDMGPQNGGLSPQTAMGLGWAPNTGPNAQVGAAPTQQPMSNPVQAPQLQAPSVAPPVAPGTMSAAPPQPLEKPVPGAAPTNPQLQPPVVSPPTVSQEQGQAEPPKLIQVPKTLADLQHNRLVQASTSGEAALATNAAASQIAQTTFQQQQAAAKKLADDQAEQDRMDKKTRDESAQESAGFMRKGQEIANRSVDPAGFYHHGSTAQNIFLAIGSALSQAAGQYGAAMTHTSNTAAQIINAAVERDVAEQQRKISAAKNSNDEAHRISTEQFGVAMDASKLARAQKLALYSSAMTQIQQQATLQGITDPSKVQSLQAAIQGEMVKVQEQNYAENRSAAAAGASQALASRKEQEEFENKRSEYIAKRIEQARDTDKPVAPVDAAKEYDTLHPLEVKRYGNTPEGLGTEAGKKVVKPGSEEGKANKALEDERGSLQSGIDHIKAIESQNDKETWVLGGKERGDLNSHIAGARQDVETAEHLRYGKITAGLAAQQVPDERDITSLSHESRAGALKTTRENLEKRLRELPPAPGKKAEAEAPAPVPAGSKAPTATNPLGF